MAMESEKLRKDGNEKFKVGKFIEAVDFYTKALKLDPESHLTFSNRSIAYSKMGEFELALKDANCCVEVNAKWGKGYLRKAVALNLLKRHEEAKDVAMEGFGYCDVQLASELVKEWLTAGKAWMAIKHSHLLQQLAEVIPDYAEMFCDEYCRIMFITVLKRLSDSDGMTHDEMIAAISGSVQIANDVLTQFHQPSSMVFQEWVDAVSIEIELYPISDKDHLKLQLEHKTTHLTKWLKDDLHKSLRQVVNPIVMLALSAVLVRCNVLCQAYTAHSMAEYLGLACAGLFDSGCFPEPIYVPLNLAVLNIFLSIFRTQAEVITEKDLELIRVVCHKMDDLIHKIPTSHSQFDFLKAHYEQAVKVSREICAKVISGFKGSHDPKSALSELEMALLEIDSKPDKALDLGTKYLEDIAQKIQLSESSSVNHINFIDAENMLYLTGIFVKLKMLDHAKKVFQNGENMLFSLIASVLEKKVLTLEQLPATVTNGRAFALSGAIWLKEHFPVIAADVFIRWKSLFTELRAILIQLGLRDAYMNAFLAIERHGSDHSSHSKLQALKEFKAVESQLIESSILPVINVLYQQTVKAVASVIEESDIVLDYSFNIYNPQYHNPPKSQACGFAILSGADPLFFSIDNEKVFELLTQLAKAIYQMWHSPGKFNSVAEALSDALFPPPIRQLLLKPGISRLFICPDVDLLCFPIDQLPLKDDDSGIVKSLYEVVSVTLLSSPRELIRKQSVALLRTTSKCTDTQQESSTSNDDDQVVHHMQTLDIKDHSTQSPSAIDAQIECESVTHSQSELKPVNDKKEPSNSSTSTAECYIFANPDFNHQLPTEHESGLKSLLCTLDAFFGISTQNEKESILSLPHSQKEAENIHTLLSLNGKLVVNQPIVGSEATLSRILKMKSPFLLHIATHGYAGKQVSTGYRGNFWTDNSSGILLAGAAVFREGRYNKIDPKAGTGHMNAIAACGMQLENTRLVFISACESSVGSRPTQEMPNSFTQAIRAAGSDSVISTLWTITDEEAIEFVSYFYDHLVNKPQCRPSEALSYAKLMMKNTGKSMFYWGAFVCNGLDIPLFPA